MLKDSAGNIIQEPIHNCHCGKDGHALNSVNCPIHGYYTVGKRWVYGFFQAVLIIIVGTIFTLGLAYLISKIM